MPPKQRAKRFRKTVSDIGERRRVGPVESDEEYSDMDMELLRRQKRRKLNEEAAKVTEGIVSSDGEGDEQPGDRIPNAQEVEEKDSTTMFSSMVASALAEGNEGLLGNYSLREQKREERAKRKLEKKRLKKKRAFDVEGGQGYISESSESEASEDERMAAKRLQAKRSLKKQMLTQAHNRPTPSLAQPDYEKTLRRIATKGVVRLFNAVAAAQKKAQADEDEPDRPGVLSVEPGESAAKKKQSGPSKDEVTRSKFLDMLRKGSDSKRIQDAEDTAKADKEAARKGPVKKARHNRK